MMEKKYTDEKNYLSVRIKWCALLAAGLIGAFLVRMWVVCIREMQSLMVPAVFTALSAALAVIVYRTVLIPYRETRKIYEQFVMGYVMEDLFKVRYPFSPESEQAVLRLNEIIDRNNLIAISKKQAEYLALQNQINPHFLYNTLEGIRSEALIAGLDSIAEMTEALATFFRYTISNLENLVTLEDELANIENYYYIQQFRFGSKLDLKIQYDRDPDDDFTEMDFLQCKLPKLTLQPIVENSFIHGIKPMDGPGHIQLMAERLDNTVTLTVMDNGVGMDEDALNKLYTLLDSDQPGHKENYEWASIGLKNVHDRLRYLYGSDYGITLYSTPGVGTVVKATIPADLQNLAQEEPLC
mgnify:CR=1 FL=1